MYQELKFSALRQANQARVGHFKNVHGQVVHSKSDGSDWTPAQWLQAVVGEVGEYANLRKKFERGDVPVAAFTHEAAKELADMIIYIDLLASVIGVDLSQAVTSKFNEVSRRVGSPVFIDPYGVVFNAVKE